MDHRAELAQPGSLWCSQTLPTLLWQVLLSFSSSQYAGFQLCPVLSDCSRAFLVGHFPPSTYLSYLGQPPLCLKPVSSCLRRIQQCPSWSPQNSTPISCPFSTLVWPVLYYSFHILLHAWDVDPSLIAPSLLHSQPCSLPASSLQH